MNDLVIIQTTQGLAHYILECNPQVTNTFLKLKNSILLSKVVCIVNETDGFDYYLTSNSKLRVEFDWNAVYCADIPNQETGFCCRTIHLL